MVVYCETADYYKIQRSFDQYVKLLAKILRDVGYAVEKGCGTCDVTHLPWRYGSWDPNDLKFSLAFQSFNLEDVQRATINSMWCSIPEKPS